MKVANTTFLFREVEQLVVYQMLSNLDIWEDLGWLSSGSELESMWGPHIKSIVPTTIAKLRVIISIGLIATLGTVVCYMFWQAGDICPMWVR